jgi:hypothetical protein
VQLQAVAEYRFHALYDRRILQQAVEAFIFFDE